MFLPSPNALTNDWPSPGNTAGADDSPLAIRRRRRFARGWRAAADVSGGRAGAAVPARQRFPPRRRFLAPPGRHMPAEGTSPQSFFGSAAWGVFSFWGGFADSPDRVKGSGLVAGWLPRIGSPRQSTRLRGRKPPCTAENPPARQKAGESGKTKQREQWSATGGMPCAD